eukprot:6484301-Prorocentrum_lima.AAC.1
MMDVEADTPGFGTGDRLDMCCVRAVSKRDMAWAIALIGALTVMLFSTGSYCSVDIGAGH